jgi:hypothetical protein
LWFIGNQPATKARSEGNEEKGKPEFVEHWGSVAKENRKRNEEMQPLLSDAAHPEFIEGFRLCCKRKSPSANSGRASE